MISKKRNTYFYKISEKSCKWLCITFLSLYLKQPVQSPNWPFQPLSGWEGQSQSWTGVQLLVFFCSSVPVVLFDTPGISRCRSQHVSVESSSLLHHSIYLWFICFTWWSIDELENLHADRTTVCFEPWQKLRARLGARKTGLSPPVFLYWPFQGGTSVLVPYCSCCLCLYFGSSIMLVTYFVNFR